VHCPAGAEALTLLETTFTVLLTVADLVAEAEEATLVEDCTLRLAAEESVVRLDDFTVLAAIEELLEILLDLALAHTNCVCPICQAPLMLNDSKTMLSMAFKFAPENALNGTVYVWVVPVTPVKVVK
jgi:hypothetical protein